MTSLSRAEAALSDAADPLGPFRSRFLIADETIYMDGNSLGRLPLAAREELQRVVDVEWGEGLVQSWEHWIDLSQRVGSSIAPLIGAATGEVSLADSTSVNLYRLAGAALSAIPGRSVIVTDSGNFPTDRYVLGGLARERGMTIMLVDRQRDGTLDLADVTAALDDDVALVSFSHVDYRSGAIADMAAINAVAHDSGALTLWDLSHAVGSVPIDLSGHGADLAGCSADLAGCSADLAVGCTYKYLNGGPGAPAFMFVRGELQDELLPPIQGWFAHAEQFAFAPDFRPATSIDGFLVGTPPILSASAVAIGVSIVAEAGMAAIRS
ncbi:aminotransferase class V-fold PLP-dependent enzyme, partial [bacterium]|nr:aminotransferase class V-fold PLP-dependent enzyme [bacterium]